MGLDTVELVVNIEKHFGLEIPDLVCEQLGTVGDVANWLGQRSCLESRIGRYFLQKAANNCFDGFNSFLVPRWYPRNLPQKRGAVSSAPFQWLNSCEK